MKITIEGRAGEGKTTLARVLSDLCRKHGIEVSVSDPDIAEGEGPVSDSVPKRYTISAEESKRLAAMGARGARIDILTVQWSRRAIER